MPSPLFTNNFKTFIFDLLEKYDNSNLNLMISGGSLLNVLDNPSYSSLDTSKWSIYYADERVDPKGSNYKGSLPFLNSLKGKVYRMEVEDKDCARNYSKLLPKIDICLLGVGPDGHICSLFPDTPSLDSQDKVISITNPKVQFPERVTTTLKFLNSEVENLYFVIPDKNGEVKEVKEPHCSIKRRLTKDYVIVLYKNE
ncbi:6-phosphogluconolactonase 4 [Nosema bombycis CQ1]|uniref:6-phosphogluconolactonase 4 n=1 Tax=Nosema bombycis (strain CQ1 / CVCC 102059) TaxID=578461 RepID=R0MKA1_NOSB1|nr:6-phosphogluconolactonase 4 [Nosema bombycis CQ1]|eukprot:EOB14670.1 6-phosphogluconolactonase 4 [Nosema bombycis CQ1]